MGLYILKYPARRVLGPLAAAMRRVHPDVLSYAAVPVAAATGVCLAAASARPILWLWAIGLTLARMTLNTLDGVLAIARGNLSLKGEIVNALPDRFSDVFMLAGILFSPLCPPALAMAAMASTLLVSYSGMLGKALGVQWQHQGPLGKVERLILIMVACLLEYLRATLGWREWSVAGYAVAPIEMAMVLFVLLGPVTIFNRTRGMLRQIARLEWRQKLAASPPPLRVLVAYDSLTGNTEKVAAALAESLHADLRRVEQVRDVRMYDLVVVGSPVISSKPTAKVAAFLSVNAGLPYALFMTYGGAQSSAEARPERRWPGAPSLPARRRWRVSSAKAGTAWSTRIAIILTTRIFSARLSLGFDSSLWPER